MPRSTLAAILPAILATMLLPTGAHALVDQNRFGCALAERQFSLPELEAVASLIPAHRLPAELRSEALGGLGRLGVAPEAALLDPLGGRWATLRLAAPLLPGTGVGNRLTWEPLGSWSDADDEALLELAWKRVTHYLYEHASLLRLEIDELVPSGVWLESGDLVQFSAERHFAGLPVRGARFTAVLNHGNLVLVGAQRWGDVEVDLLPEITAAKALAPVVDHVQSRRGDPPQRAREPRASSRSIRAATSPPAPAIATGWPGCCGPRSPALP